MLAYNVVGKMAEIYIGTSGWSYPEGKGTWKGTFYPPGTADELSYYSRFFKTVEVNSSFYRPPNPGYVTHWVKKTPADFLFTVKLWQKFTHPGMYREATGEIAAISQEDVDMFRRSLEPLLMAQKMGALLAQFPPSFRNDSFGQSILEAVSRHFSACRLAIELRHKSWSGDPGTEKLLRQNNIAWVQIDEPKFSSSIAAELPVTADFAYFRFHGRNAANWKTGNVETRYEYLYSPAEIAELTAQVKKAAGQTKLTFAFFNNHPKADAPRNAGDMIKALQMPFTDFPVVNMLGMN